MISHTKKSEEVLSGSDSYNAPPFVKTTFNNFLIPPYYATFGSKSFSW